MNPTTDPAAIPLVDLHWQHEQIAAEITPALDEVMRTGAFIDGAAVKAFEAAYAAFSGAAHCIGVANGTDALELAFRAAGLPAGTEVVLPANTFIATAEAVVRAGLRVHLVDCDPVHQLLDVEQARDAVAGGAGAVVAVDLFGQVAPFEALEGLGVPVFEDAAQSQGATRHGRGAGTFGIAAGTSFYPGKNLGAYGDAGAVLTDDDTIAASIRALRNHGSTVKYRHDIVGVNSRLDTVQAVVLAAKLARLAKWNELRRAAAERYAALLAGVAGVELPTVAPGNEHVWHLYVVQVDERDAVLADLLAAGIGAGIHYPVPVHRTAAFADLGHAVGAFPVAERLADRILSLPVFPGIQPVQQERVAEALVRSLRA